MAKEEDEEESSLLDDCPFTYTHVPPLPGSSLGPKDKPDCAGTLLGYIRHGNKTYALTCENVVNGTDSTVIGSNESFKFDDAKRVFSVLSPAAKDHDNASAETRSGIDLFDRLESTDTKTQHERMKARGVFEETLKEEANYNTSLGYLYATSGQDIREGTFRFDWAIIRCRFEWSVQNKHRRFNHDFPCKSGSRLPPNVKKSISNRVEPDWYDKTAACFEGSPHFKSVRDKPLWSEEIYLKPPSRTCGWKVAICNGIKAIVKKHSDVLSKEWCFFTPRALDYVSRKGDSGSVILDSQYHPPVMIWGGCTDAFPEMTHANSLRDVLRDIELRMGWDEGSVVFC